MWGAKPGPREEGKREIPGLCSVSRLPQPHLHAHSLSTSCCLQLRQQHPLLRQSRTQLLLQLGGVLPRQPPAVQSTVG